MFKISKEAVIVLLISALIIPLFVYAVPGVSHSSDEMTFFDNGKLRVGNTIIWDNEINRVSDATNKEIHIGYRDTNVVSLVANGGNVGIGTNNPQTNLDVVGNIMLSSPDTGIYSILLSRTDENSRNHRWGFWHMNSVHSKNALDMWEYKTDSAGVSCGGNTEDGAMCNLRFRIYEGGNITIPNSLISVSGGLYVAQPQTPTGVRTGGLTYYAGIFDGATHGLFASGSQYGVVGNSETFGVLGQGNYAGVYGLNLQDTSKQCLLGARNYGLECRGGAHIAGGLTIDRLTLDRTDCREMCQRDDSANDDTWLVCNPNELLVGAKWSKSPTRVDQERLCVYCCS